MAATTTDRETPFAGLYPAKGTFGMRSNTIIRKGWLVGIDVNGRAIVGGTIASGCLCGMGVASSTVDNQTGSEAGGLDDSTDIELEYGIHGFLILSADIQADDVGKVAYVVDNQTVSSSSNTAARPPAGIIHEVRDGMAWIQMGPQTRNLTVT
jgi:hypothetical protein